jgi:DNA repair protein RecO (recombination protein O)
MSRAARRVQLAEGYVLHQRPYRDTSRIVEVFTREHGRLTLFARGVRGPKSRLAPVLQPFRRLLLSFLLGRGDAAQLTGAELADAAAATPRAETLMSAYYLSELLLKLTERLDAQPALYEAYSQALQRLCEPGPEAPALREFELQLLQACGYGIDFAGLEPTQRYLFTAGVGFAPSQQRGEQRGEQEDSLSGAALLAVAAGHWHDPEGLAAAGRILRAALDQCLDGYEIRTRAVARSVRRQVLR